MLPTAKLLDLTMKSRTHSRKWYNWYSPEDTPEERILVRKLDLLIVPYAFVLYWIKYMDQTNISMLPPPPGAGREENC